MHVEHGEDAAVANAQNWIRLCFHALTCNNPGCVLGDRCIGGKQLLSHVLTCDNPGACLVGSCSAVRRLALHWLRCQDVNCRLCAGVWRDLSGAPEESEGNEGNHINRPGHVGESAPPEAPGTPDRFGLPAQVASFDTYWPINPAMDRSGSPFHRGQELPVAARDIAEPLADRAVIQLQEATSYMRYLLHGLMCRNSREAAVRAPGLQFWLSVLLPEDQQQQPAPPLQPPGAEAEAAAAAGGPIAAPVAAAVDVAAAGLHAPRPAGRRLLAHRLNCRNPYCALCAGTCELFTRGNALRQDLPAPTGLRDMDQIVQELSLALGSFNL